jgi:hypothetical protein
MKLECGRRTDLDRKVLEAMLTKLSSDPNSDDFVNPHRFACQFSWTRRRCRCC